MNLSTLFPFPYRTYKPTECFSLHWLAVLVWAIIEMTRSNTFHFPSEGFHSVGVYNLKTTNTFVRLKITSKLFILEVGQSLILLLYLKWWYIVLNFRGFFVADCTMRLSFLQGRRHGTFECREEVMIQM